jgi:hypothetical protein
MTTGKIVRINMNSCLAKLAYPSNPMLTHSIISSLIQHSHYSKKLICFHQTKILASTNWKAFFFLFFEFCFSFYLTSFGWPLMLFVHFNFHPSPHLYLNFFIFRKIKKLMNKLFFHFILSFIIYFLCWK